MEYICAKGKFFNQTACSCFVFFLVSSKIYISLYEHIYFEKVDPKKNRDIFPSINLASISCSSGKTTVGRDKSLEILYKINFVQGTLLRIVAHPCLVLSHKFQILGRETNPLETHRNSPALSKSSMSIRKSPNSPVTPESRA